MSVNEMKHQAKLAEWREKIAECRSQEISVEDWCKLNSVSTTTYYRWEREIFGRAKKPTINDTTELVPVRAPLFAELAVSETAAEHAVVLEAPSFQAAAVIRVGNMRMELSNKVSTNLAKQLKELLLYAE